MVVFSHSLKVKDGLAKHFNVGKATELSAQIPAEFFVDVDQMIFVALIEAWDYFS